MSRSWWWSGAIRGRPSDMCVRRKEKKTFVERDREYVQGVRCKRKNRTSKNTTALYETTGQKGTAGESTVNDWTTMIDPTGPRHTGHPPLPTYIGKLVPLSLCYCALLNEDKRRGRNASLRGHACIGRSVAGGLLRTEAESRSGHGQTRPYLRLVCSWAISSSIPSPSVQVLDSSCFDQLWIAHD